MTEEDEEGLRDELKEAFRIYDKEGNGYITTDVLKEILREIDPELTEDDLDNIIEEVDEDGSGTLDFDEFQEMMMGWEGPRKKKTCQQRIHVIHIFYWEIIAIQIQYVFCTLISLTCGNPSCQLNKHIQKSYAYL